MNPGVRRPRRSGLLGCAEGMRERSDFPDPEPGPPPQHRPDMNPELDQNNPEFQAALETCQAQGGRRRCAVRTSFEAIVSEVSTSAHPRCFRIDRNLPETAAPVQRSRHAHSRSEGGRHDG
jgi:hypothetical protein